MKDIKSVVIVFTYLFFHISISYEHSYNFTCPSQANWKIRAKSRCNITSTYFCLYNDVERLYVEGCDGPDYDRSGNKRIYAGDFTRGQCIQRRYQPYEFWTNGSTSDCIYDKSLCIEEGQTVYQDGSPKEDRTCRCDNNKSYSFINTPRNICYCIPSEEDCSCYIKSCPVNLTLSADYVCIQNGYTEDQMHTDYKVNESGPLQTENNSFSSSKKSYNVERKFQKSVSVILYICVISIFVSVGFFLALICYKWISKKLLPVTNLLRRHTDIKTDTDESQRIFTRCLSVDSTHESYESLSDDKDQLDEIFYLRIIHLLFRVACPAVRMKFNLEIKPDQLRRTLEKNKSKMIKEHRTETHYINDQQWDILYKGKTVTSDSFDIRLMVYLLRTLSNFYIEAEYPVSIDSSYSAMLSKIKFIRNEAVRKFQGKLSKIQFDKYWHDIGQAVLKLISQHKFEIDDDKVLMQLLGRLLVLNPVDTNNICKFIDLSEYIPSLILKQIIYEYCTSKNVKIDNLLNDEKHALYHKRFETESCCVCEKSGLPPCKRTISEEKWGALYEMNDSSTLHSCPSSLETCSECFIPKDINKGDVSMFIPLILFSQNILFHVTSRLCGNSLNEFLIKNKHTLYHHRFKENKCCECNKVITETISFDETEWDTLFEKRDKSSCKTNSVDCFCKYVTRNKIMNYSDINDCFLFKILHVGGPFAFFNKIEESAFLQFLNWSVSNLPIQEALTELLCLVDDKEFKDKISTLIHSPLDTHSGKDDVREWASRHSPKLEATTGQQLQILIRDKECLRVKSVQIPNELHLSPRTEQFTDLTDDENSFLVVMYGLTKFVYPVIKKVFDTTCTKNELSTIQKDYDEHRCSDKSKSKKLSIYLTTIEYDQLFPPQKETSRNLDLKLMIYILKKINERKGKTQYVKQLEIIDDIKTEIVQSSTGTLDKERFKDIVNQINRSVEYFGMDKKNADLQKLRHLKIF